MTQSELLFKRALDSIPGGVNSPVRAFKGVGGTPIFFKEGKGAYLTDVDGRQYIDYVGSWGPLILGHAHERVISAVIEAAQHGVSFGAPCELEIQLAEKIKSLMPSIEKVRMVNSGTEATITAIRVARAVTQKNKVIKFNGCYHGHHDSLLVKAGSGVLTLGIPGSPGIPESITQHTCVAEFNHLEQTEQLFNEYPKDVAAVILEPIAGNMGLVMPDPVFLKGLRSLCDAHGALLIFDEVMTGFRVALGGAQSLYEITPDLTTLGKVIGGGMPVGAIGGRASMMDHLAPLGNVYQAGTLSGNPLAMAAGLATLSEIESPGFYDCLGEKSAMLMSGLKDIADHNQIPLQAASVGGMFGFCFNDKSSITSYEDIAASNESRFRQFYHSMLAKGVYLAPSMFEAGFISSAHSVEDIQATLRAAKDVLSEL